MLTTLINPRFSDTDALGHINNTVIPVWFLEARTPILGWFTNGADVTDQMKQGAMAVVRIEIDYLSEIKFGMEVEVLTEVAEIGKSSFKLIQQVKQNGTVCAQGLTTLVSFDASTRRATRLTSDQRQQLEKHLQQPHQ
jgi:acyl-CoA thioester hydrolase